MSKEDLAGPATRMDGEASPSRCPPSKKNQGKGPKRVHKAEREKMKRDHLNELFLALANALELSDPNNGKASVLGEATRFAKEVLAQIESLKRENAALLSESQYVTMEKNELQDETSALESQIAKLKTELQDRTIGSKLDLNMAPPECQHQMLASHSTEDNLQMPASGAAFPQPQIMNPVYVLPICSDPKLYPQPETAQIASEPMAVVSKPHARYPTPADTWPSQLLEMHPHPQLEKEFQGSVNCHTRCVRQ